MYAVFVDLDGTLLNSEAQISKRNLQYLYKLKASNVFICAVTGRNLFSAFKVLASDLPFDYLIFSTGIGVFDFNQKKIIESYHIQNTDAVELINLLKASNLNFFVQHKVPQNHRNYYHYTKFDSDFELRLSYYDGFSEILPDNLIFFEPSQIVVFLSNDEHVFNSLKSSVSVIFPHLSLVRATSPLNLKSIWLEVYPPNVNKGKAIEKLCTQLSIDLSNTFAIGNDYNDLEMLDICAKSFVVANSPKELKTKYNIVESNDKDGFSDAIDKSGLLSVN